MFIKSKVKRRNLIKCLYGLVFFFIFNLISLIFNLKSALAAAPTGSLEVEPVFVEVVLESAEQTKEIVISYKNNSGKPLNLEIFPIDFKQADGTGAINFLGAESGSFSYSLSSFLSFESNSIQLDPGAKKKFTVTVKNREDLSPGGHYAAVVARLVSEGEIDQAQVAPSISSLILLRKVGGERFNMSLSDLDFPNNPVIFSYPSSVTALFKNEGNIHLVPFGIVETKDLFGRVLYKGIVNTSSLRVFPESRRYIGVDMQKMGWSSPISLNTVTITGEDSLQKVKFNYRDTFLYINPVFFTILIAVVIAVLVFKKRIVKSFRNKLKIKD